jgi:lantibiotic biosynthesis protein
VINSREHFLAAADRIGSRLCRDAWWSGGACNWFGWASAVVNRQWTPVYQALGPSELNPLAGVNLYSGTAGIALFLARLSNITHDSIHIRTLKGAINQILNSSFQDHPSFGFYAGQSGIAYALLEAGKVLQNQSLIDRGLHTLTKLRHIETRPGSVDVLEGSAGLIPVLLKAAQQFDCSELGELAIQHGRHLLSLAERTNEGLSWKTIPAPVQKHLTGFSHGVSGVVFALLELYRFTSDSEFLQAAKLGIQYEQNQFDEPEQNWLDHQVHETSIPNAPRCRTAWCHGAPGIGLTRLVASELIPNDPDIRNQLQTALETTERDAQDYGEVDAAIESLGQTSSYSLPSRRDWCLCHGRAGNADVLLLAADQLHDNKYREIAESVGNWGIKQFEANHLNWSCSIGGPGESPDLLTGLAGVGYFYLRLFDSIQTPTVLLVPSS